MGSKLCAIVFFILLPITAMAAQEIKVGVSVDCDLPTSLLMSAYNNTSAAIEISEAMLPWNYSRAFYAQAFKVSEGRSTELVRVAPPANYLRQITFAPHQALRGDIKLDNIFVGFPSENERSDIIVFYRIRKLAGDKLANFEERSGAVFFPKKSFFGDNCPVLINPHL